LHARTLAQERIVKVVRHCAYMELETEK